MTTFFGAIADDFTGATDLAALLARSGVRVSLRLGVPQGIPEKTAPLEIIALKCRTAPAADAVAQALSALEWLQRAGAQRYFWKYCSTFDSTPRGNIGPVAEALMRRLGVDQTIYCPAFPENGRSIFMGNLFVGELPLAESAMKDHPLTPMRDSNLMRLLTPQVSQAVGLLNRLAVAKGPNVITQRLEALQAEGIAHVIVDAVANGDLLSIAESCNGMRLLTGGSALAMPLPEQWRKQGLLEWSTSSNSRSFPPGRAIVLSGSCSAMTNRQVAAFRNEDHPNLRIDPVKLAADGTGPLLEWLSRIPVTATPLMYATASAQEVHAAQAQLGADRAGQLVEAALADVAVAARGLGYRRFVVAGGETAGVVSNALGIMQLDIGQEIAPGVPWCLAESGGQSVAVTLKSGNFGSETFFQDALALMAQ